MMVHPLGLAVIAGDVVALVLLFMAAISSARLVTGWSPGAPTRRQLLLERRSEASSIQGRCAFWAFLLGSLVLVISVAAVLPPIVPGAMCGTGVVEATGGLANRALALRLLALVLLGAWRLTDRLGRAAPISPLGTLPARLLLLVTPIATIAALDTAAALGSLDVHTPVDCCAVVFDQVNSVVEATRTWGLSDGVWTWLTVALGALLLPVAVWTGAAPGRLATSLLALLAIAWVPVAAVAMVRVFSAYHYGVLHHHCPWCLFLAEHHLVGYAVFGALLVVLFDGVGVFLAARFGRIAPGLAERVSVRVRQGAWRAALAVCVYGLLTAVPALAWRLRFGVWMS